MNDYFNSIEGRIAAIPTPKFDFAAVRLKAAGKPQRATHRRNLIAAIILIIAAPIVAAAAAHFVPLQVTHRFGNWQLNDSQKGETRLHPTPQMFSKLARQAPYPVVWPAGLPRKHSPIALSSSGSEVFIVIYRCAGQQGFQTSSGIIAPKNYSALNPQFGKWFMSQLQDHRQNALWDVGSERILFGSDCLSQQQIAHVRAATIAQGSAQR